MKLPNYKKLFKQDYAQEYQELVDALAASLNIGIETLYNALNKRLTFRDNFAVTIKDVEVTVNASGIPTTSTGFSIDANQRVDGLDVWRVDNLTNTTAYPTGGVFITWTQGTAQTANAVTINHVTGLVTGNKYRIRVVAYYA